MVSTANVGRSVFGCCPTGNKQLNQIDQLSPWHHKIHFTYEHAFASALGDKPDPSACRTNLFHRKTTFLRTERLAGFCRVFLSRPRKVNPKTTAL